MGRSCNPVPRLDCGDSGRDEPGDDDEETVPARWRSDPANGWARRSGCGLGRRYRRRELTCDLRRILVVRGPLQDRRQYSDGYRKRHRRECQAWPQRDASRWPVELGEDACAQVRPRLDTIISRTARSMASSSRLSESCLSVIRVSHSGHLLFQEPAVPRKRATSRCRPAHRG